jgi:simple sugar transport system permease protein
MARPTLRLEPRLEEPSRSTQVVSVAVAILGAAAMGAFLVALSGHDPLIAFAALYRGAFGSVRAISGTINKAVPIGLCALGIALAYRGRLWNMGAEGQLYFGAFAAAGVGLAIPGDLPSAVAVPAVLAAGLVGGALWALIAALLRAYLDVSEILSTLMLNYVAILWVSYLVVGPWADPTTFSFPYSPPIASAAQLGKLFGSVHVGVLALIALVLLVAAFDRGARVAYELRVTGDAPRAALYGGIDSRRLAIAALAAAGALAGLAGAVEVAGSTTRLQAGLSPGYGFMGIMVAWLGRGRPLLITVCALLYAGLLNGGFSLQVSGIPPAISTILQAILLIAVLAVLTLSAYRIRLVAREAS